jgi:hypothetical protein
MNETDKLHRQQVKQALLTAYSQAFAMEKAARAEANAALGRARKAEKVLKEAAAAYAETEQLDLKLSVVESLDGDKGYTVTPPGDEQQRPDKNADANASQADDADQHQAQQGGTQDPL